MSMVQDTDLNEEFNRDTHLIMDLPMRNRHSMKQVIEYCLVAILSHSTVQTQCTSSSHAFTNSVTTKKNHEMFYRYLFLYKVHFLDWDQTVEKMLTLLFILTKKKTFCNP